MHFESTPEYRYTYPQYRESVRLNRVKPAELLIAQEDVVKTRIIGLIKGELLTEELIVLISGIEIDRDILEIAVLESHHYSGNIGLGFVKGFGLICV